MLRKQFSKGNAQESSNGEAQPHPDSQANIDFFNRIMAKVIVLNDCFKWSVSDSRWDGEYNAASQEHEAVQTITEHKNAMFSWTDKGERKYTTISFHEKNAEFRDTLAWFLNRMGQLGLVNKKGFEKAKKPAFSEWSGDKWFESLERGNA